MESKREIGIIKYWKQKSGYGFIMPDIGGEDVFLHVDQLPNNFSELHPGDKVSYLRRQGPRGYFATECDLVG